MTCRAAGCNGVLVAMRSQGSQGWDRVGMCGGEGFTPPMRGGYDDSGRLGFTMAIMAGKAREERIGSQVRVGIGLLALQGSEVE